MEFIINLTIFVITLVLLATLIALTTRLTARPASHPLSWHRRRRAILRVLAGGVMLR